MDIDVINTMGIGKIKIVMLKGEKGDTGAAGQDGSSGNYSQLTNKPSLNGVTIDGSHTSDYYALASATAVQENTDDIAALQSEKAEMYDSVLYFRLGTNTDPTDNPHAELRAYGNSTNGWSTALVVYDAEGNQSHYNLVDADGTWLSTKAPTSHASAETTYGLGTTANYGHVKIIDNLNASAYVAGSALSAYQGYLLNQTKVGRDSPTLRFRLSSNTESAAQYPHAELREFGNDTDGRSLSLVVYHSASSSDHFVLVGQDGSYFPDLAPKLHNSTDSRYGLGTYDYFGHVKLVDNLNASSYAVGNALSAYQGYVLNDIKAPKLSPNLKFRVGNNQTSADILPHAEIREWGSNENGWALGAVYVDTGGTSHGWTIIDKEGNFIPTKAPLQHNSEETTYGRGTATLYGHNKVINNLTTSSNTAGESLSAYQGYVLKGLFDSIHVDTVTVNNVAITASSYVSESTSVAKSGYTPLAAVGFSIGGTGSTYCCLGSLNVSGGNCTWRLKNVSSNALSGMTLTLYILYVKA